LTKPAMSWFTIFAEAFLFRTLAARLAQPRSMDSFLPKSPRCASFTTQRSSPLRQPEQRPEHGESRFRSTHPERKKYRR
jgi:hypothetical protein